MLLFAAMIIRSLADSGNAIETTSPEITNATTDIPAIRLCGPEEMDIVYTVTVSTLEILTVCIVDALMVIQVLDVSM